MAFVRRRLPSEEYWSRYRVWLATALVASFTLVTFAPRYPIVGKSYLATTIIVYLFQWLLYGIYAMVIFPRFLSPLKHLPGPGGGSFLMGHFFTFITDPAGAMRKWAEEVPNDGLVRYLNLFNREHVLVTSPRGLAEVLNTKNYDFVKPELLRTGLARILGNGIILVEGDEHKVQRKNLMPAFNFRHVKELYPVFWVKSREMVTRLGEDLMRKSPDTVVEIGGWANRATLDIIGLAGMGQDFNSLANPDTELNQTYRKVLDPTRTAQLIGAVRFLIPDWIFENLPIKFNNEIEAAAKLARDTSRRLIRRKEERIEKKEVDHPDIISIALESGGFTEDQLLDNMMTFLAAGHETTASAFNWAAYLLCLNPTTQTRLRAEVRQTLPSLDSKVDHVMLDSMQYLHAVCNEVLRLYAPVPLTIREAVLDTSILGTFIPKGTKLIIAPWATNVSKELWGEDAEAFNPDRWMGPGMANSGGAESNYAFLTFSHGPRSCIGQRFAVAEFACLVAAFVGRYEFELKDPDEKIEIKGGLTARPKNGMWLKVKAVEGW